MLQIVKIGGELLDNKDLLKISLMNFNSLNGQKILVHGGGKLASIFSKRLGITPKIISGRRITDYKTLKIVLMTYAGIINKTLVARLQSICLNALGISGADGDMIRAIRRVANNDYVGDLHDKSINPQNLDDLILAGFIPVFCAITHDGNGNLLNTNADTIAAEIAISMAKTKKVYLHYCIDKKGVLQDQHKSNSYFKQINYEKFHQFKTQNLITNGMIPKLENAFAALKKGVSWVSIGHPMFLTNSISGKTILYL